MKWFAPAFPPEGSKPADTKLYTSETHPPCWVESSISPSEAPNKRVAPRHSGGRALVAMVLEDAGGLGAYRKLIHKARHFSTRG